MHHDYLMRQIQILTLCIAHHCNREQVVHEVTDPYRNEASNELYKLLMEMLADGKINEAEDLLFDRVEQEKINQEDVLDLAFDFYLKVNAFSDDFLELCHFSREEANAGWADITKMCGLLEATS